jgi:DHA2 family multidrug resistance protein-like MFS transporter
VDRGLSTGSWSPGRWITSFSVGGAIGPLLGGVLLEWFWWGSVFLLAVPVMALLLVLGLGRARGWTVRIRAP